MVVLQEVRTAIADADGVLMNDAGTMRQTTVQTLKLIAGSHCRNDFLC